MDTHATWLDPYHTGLTYNCWDANLNVDDKLLFVDDVCGSGHTLDVVLSRLKMRLKRNTPNEIKIATIWNKPEKRRTEIEPDFYVHETNDWLVLPYELNGLSDEEISKEKPIISELLKA